MSIWSSPRANLCVGVEGLILLKKIKTISAVLDEVDTVPLQSVLHKEHNLSIGRYNVSTVAFPGEQKWITFNGESFKKNGIENDRQHRFSVNQGASDEN